jgi:diadenosine tetraphosphate (Ap4A) HIT family hydrolase
MEPTKPCIFCITDPAKGVGGNPADPIVKAYNHWWLILQTAEKRASTKQAAGMLIPKRHVPVVSELKPEEAAELFAIYKDAGEMLCETVGATYTGQETVGFNEGPAAGQTIQHAHIHVLPVAEEDPEVLKVRGGMGGAFEALRAERLHDA